MAERNPILDWDIQDNEAMEEDHILAEAATVAPEPAVPARSRLSPRARRILRGLGAVMLLAAVMLALIAWQRARDNIIYIRGDIETTILLEGRAWLTRDEELEKSLVDDQASAGWRYRFDRIESIYRRWSGDDAQMPKVEVRDLELRGDKALVETVITQPNATWARSPYRETRFYRYVDGRWLRTAPDAAFWGQRRDAETPHFRFTYYDRDAATVEALAANAETLYAQLRADAGLDPAPAGRVMTIEVLPQIDLVSWRFTGDRLTLPSPALLPVPADHTDTDRLARSLVRPLSARVLDEALERAPIKPGWRPLVNGMARWSAWQAGPLPSPWEAHFGGHLRRALADGQPPSLSALTGPATSGLDPWATSMAAESVVDYVVRTYGRERLPALLGGMTLYDSWDTLIPAVFGVPRSQFEANWQRVILIYYGPPELLGNNRER